MKKFSLFALAALGLMLGACSDKDIVSEENSISPDANGTEQFITFGINLPTVPVTRATDADNDQLSDADAKLVDGLPSEYAVYDAILVTFSAVSGGTEDDAVFKKAYRISPQPWTSSDDHQVTQKSRKIVQQVDGNFKGGDLLLVMLNTKPEAVNFLAKVDDAGKLYLNGSTDEFGKGSTKNTYADLRQTLVTSSSIDNATATMITSTGGFYMANAPLSDKQGTISDKSTVTGYDDMTLQTLVPVPANAIYKTFTEATLAEANQIYVERGMAKVTVNQMTGKYMTGEGEVYTTSASKSTISTDGSAGTGEVQLNMTISGWSLDNTNQKSYLIRSNGMSDTQANDISVTIPYKNLKTTGYTGLTSYYRYVGNTAITEGTPNPYKYRPYWAQDPNYNIDARSELSKIFVKEGTPVSTNWSSTLSYYTGGFGDNNPRYCFENTFDVQHQTQENTTLVRLAVQTNIGSEDATDLFIINNTKSTIYTKTAIEQIIEGLAIDIINEEHMHVDGKAAITIDDFDFTFSGRKEATFSIAVKSASTEKFQDSDVTGHSYWDSTNEALTSDFIAAVANAFTQKYGIIDRYENGISYFTVRVKHFGDNLTPWNGNGGTNIETTLVSGANLTPAIGNIYPGYNSTTPADLVACANNYLGRYGMLRNNWYDISIDAIKYLGDAEPKEADSTTDDELDAYINVQINVLSWAKRTQSWSF